MFYSIQVCVCHLSQPQRCRLSAFQMSCRVIVIKEKHQENTLPLIMVLFGITFDANGHPQNAHSSMVVMLFRKAIEVKEQSENAHLLIVVIPSLVTTFSICSLVEVKRIVGASFSLIHP